MATLEQVIQLSITLTGEEKARFFGDKSVPTDLTVTGQVFDSGGIQIVDDYTVKTLWAANQGGLASYSYLIYTSNVDTYLELANVALATDEHLILPCAAHGVLVIPGGTMGGYVSNTDRFDGNQLIAATDYQTVDQISAYNNAADLIGDATCRLVLVL